MNPSQSYLCHRSFSHKRHNRPSLYDLLREKKVESRGKMGENGGKKSRMAEDEGKKKRRRREEDRERRRRRMGEDGKRRERSLATSGKRRTLMTGVRKTWG